MRLIHISDLHLGFRAYDRLTPDGINQREADIARTFTRVVDMLIERAPDLVIIGGDVFHHVHPTNTAMTHAAGQFMRLTSTLKDTIVVMVGGNHDTPLTSELGSILPLFRHCGVHVAEARPTRFTFPDRDLSVLAVPDAFFERPVFTPVASARYNVVVAHLETAGLITHRQPERRALEVQMAELAAERFDYVGCGHYHVWRQLAQNACYSGSIDYTSSNIWGELKEERAAQLSGKVMVERDLATGEQRLIPIPPARPVIDLPVIEGAGMSPRDLDNAIQGAVSGIAIDGVIVRQLMHGVSVSVERELDHPALRAVKARAMHFQLTCRRPEVAERPSVAAGVEFKPRDASKAMPDALIAQIRRNRETSPSDDPVEAVIEAGLRYLAEGTAMEHEKQREPVLTPDPLTAAVAA